MMLTKLMPNIFNTKLNDGSLSLTVQASDKWKYMRVGLFISTFNMEPPIKENLAFCVPEEWLHILPTSS